VRAVRSWLGLLGILAACGGQGPAAPPEPTPPPTTLAPATLADLSATVTSPEAGRRLSCSEDVHARLELTNRAASSVSVEVSGVRKASQILSGNCSPVPDFTYSTGLRRFAPHGTTVLFDRALYSDGSGCCEDPKHCGGSCKVQQTFQVVTNVGAVSAGAFSYTVVFSSECNECKATVASLSRACQPTRMKQAER